MKPLIFSIWFQLLLTVSFASDSLSIPSLYPSYLTAYDEEQGLATSCISEIIVDKKGRLWLKPCPRAIFGKSVSSYLFDGNKSYDIPLPKSDSSTWYVEGISDDGLLFGKNSRSPEVFLLDPETYEHKIYALAADEKIMSIMPGKDNSIFSLSRTVGQYAIYKHSLKEETLLSTFKKPEIVASYSKEELSAVMDKGIIWFLHQNTGFIKYDVNNNVFKEYTWMDLLGLEIPDWIESSVREFLKMTVDQNGDLIFYVNELNSFFLFDTRLEQISEHQVLNSQLAEILRHQIFRVYFFPDAKKNILIKIRYNKSKTKGIYQPTETIILLDNDNQLFKYNSIINPSIQKSRFNSDRIVHVYSKDLKKEAFLGMNGGLIITEIQTDLSIVSLLEKWPSRAMVQLDKDHIWIKGDKKKFGQIDISKQKMVPNIIFEVCNKDIDIPTFAKFINRNQQEIWFPTRDRALYSYHIKEQKCIKYPIGLLFHKFDFINENEVALVSLDGNLFIYNLKQKELRPFLHQGQALKIEGITSDIYCDKKGVLWIVATEGFWRIDTHSGEVARLGQKEGFEVDQFLSILEGEEGTLWLGTMSDGLQMYNTESGLIKVIDQNTGLSNNTVVGILSDHEGDIWVSTFKGITVLSKTGEVLFEIQKKDGLSHQEFNRSSFLKTWDGKLIFGNVFGINIIDPLKVKQIYAQKEAPKIYLTEISFFNNKSDESIVLRKNLENIGQIKLAPTHRLLNLNFALSDYLNPEKINYAYQIKSTKDKSIEEENQDKDYWISLGAKSELTLTNLPVGEFTILIKGSNHTGKWTEHHLSIPVKILPFFYNTWWFYLLCSIPIITVLFLGYRQLFTEKKRLEAEVNKRTQQIVKDKELIEEQAAKLLELDEMKSRFFTNISHEFRTPLTIISGMVPQITKEPDKWLTKGMKLIQRNSNHLLSLINQILDLRKLESGALKPNLIQADILPYLLYIIDSFRVIAQSKGIKFHLLTQQKQLIMDYDPDKMMHILSNLLSNAIKYIPGEGDIYIQIDKQNHQDQDQLIILVKDTGQGIKKEHLPFIFDRFYQVEDLASQKPQGSGVGLALTRELVNLLDGSIKVDSEWGVGTTFTLCFPISQKARLQDNQMDVEVNNIDVNENTNPVVATTPPVFSDQKIENQILTETKPSDDSPLPSLLIVEDNPEVRLYLTACLAKDYELLMAENGQEGIDLALEKVPDLIVSDVMMPIKDGFELCDTLKNDERTSHIPIILLTAKADFDSKISGLKKGADAYLTKPFQEQELLVRLDQLLILRNKLQERYKNLSEIASLPTSPKHEIEDAFIKKFRQLVIKHITEENFGVIQLCRLLRLSRSQLYKKVKALTGLSTTALVRSIRLQKAKHLLQTTNLNVSEVGYEVGINNPAYFSRIYTEEFGEAPSETRNHL